MQSAIPNQASQAPHHSATSWASHWHQRHDIADKILATYYENSEADPEDNEDLQNEEEEVEVEEEMQDDEDDDAHSETMSANETSRHQLRSERISSDFGGPNVDTDEDEANMGEPGSSFTRGDWCILARFIAKNHWDEMSRKERWQTFTETVRDYTLECSSVFRIQLMTGQYETKRTGKAWAEFYRKNEAGMTPTICDTLVLLVNQIAVAVLKLSKMYSPGSSRGNKSRRGHSPLRSRRESSQHGLDEDGEYETDNGEN